jgi:hypothetical protein
MIHNSNKPAADNTDNDETIMDWLAKIIKSVKKGTIDINAQNEPTMQINAATNRIDIDILSYFFYKV